MKTTLALIFSLFLSNIIYSQCTNLEPTATTTTVSFCAADNQRVSNLTAATGTTGMVGNGSDIAWFTTPAGGTQLGDFAVLDTGIYYADDLNDLADDGNCSVSRLAITVTVSAKELENVNNTITECESDNPTISNLSATGTGVIEWFDSQTGGTLLTSTTPLTDGSTYWVQHTENGCIAERLPTLVNLVSVPAPTLNAGDETQEFCATANPTIADLVANGNDLKWYESMTSPVAESIPSNTPLTDGASYWVSNTSTTSSCQSVDRVEVRVVIEDAPNPGVNSSYEECELFLNQNTVNLFDSLGGSPDIGGTWTGPSTLSNGHLGTFDNTIHTAGTYTYTVTSSTGICSNASATVSVTVTTTAAPTTTDTTQEFCAIDSPTIADLQVAGTNISWYANATTTTALNTTDALVNGQSYWATQTVAGCESATRLEVTVMLNTTDVPISIPIQQFCPENNPTVSDLQAVGNNINWYISETSPTALAVTDPLIDGQEYWATQTDATTGCVSARVMVTANFTVVAPPTGDPTQEFCAVDSPTIANLQATGNIGNNINWYISETDTTPLSITDALINGQQYWVSQTDAGTNCVSPRLMVTVTINNTAAPTTTDATQEFCAIDSPTIANIQVTGNNIIWYADSTSTTPLNTTDALIDGQEYWATQTDATTGCVSSTRLMVSVTLNTTDAPTTTDTTQEFCPENNPTIANIQVTGNNIIWYADATSATALDITDALIDGEDYWATQTDATTGCVSSTRLMVTVTLTSISAPTGVPTQEFCAIDSPTIADIQVTGTNISWYADATSTTALDTTDALVNGEDYWATQTDGTGCESSDRLTITVTLNITAAPTTTDTTQEFCDIDSPTIADIQVTGTDIIWYADATSATPLNSTDTLVNGEDYWATQTDATTGCVSSTRLMVTVTLNTTAAPTTTDATQEFCAVDSPTIANIQVTGNNIIWYADATSTTALDTTDALIDGEDYWATQTDATTGCVSSARLMVSVTLTTTVAPTGVPTQEFCTIDTPTIADIQVTGTNIIWYADATSTTALNTADALIDGEDYWATQTVSGCESVTRLMVSVTLNTMAAPTTTATTQEFCAIDSPTIADIQITGTNIIWYADATSNTALNITDTLIDGEDYWATQTDATTGCVSSRLLINVLLTMVDQPTFAVADGDQFCSIDNPTLQDLNNNIEINSNNTYSWYDSYPNGTLLSLDQLLEDNTTYYLVSVNSLGCASEPLIINPNLNACNNKEIILYDGFSPTGDGINDTFHIENINALYPNYNIVFYNRWGNVVYEGNASKPEWNGKLYGTGEYLPVGVYYYIIYFNKNNKKPIQDRLYLSR